jgi:hypothetical protein
MKIIALLLAFALSACERARTPVLDIATTTSVANSGLLDTLLPRFTDATVRVQAAGSGRSLAMLAGGQADAITTHAHRPKRVIWLSTPIGGIARLRRTASSSSARELIPPGSEKRHPPSMPSSGSHGRKWNLSRVAISPARMNENKNSGTRRPSLRQRYSRVAAAWRWPYVMRTNAMAIPYPMRRRGGS